MSILMQITSITDKIKKYRNLGKKSCICEWWRIIDGLHSQGDNNFNPFTVGGAHLAVRGYCQKAASVITVFNYKNN